MQQGGMSHCKGKRGLPRMAWAWAPNYFAVGDLLGGMPWLGQAWIVLGHIVRACWGKAGESAPFPDKPKNAVPRHGCTTARHAFRFATTASANSLHLSNFAPSIKRAKS